MSGSTGYVDSSLESYYANYKVTIQNDYDFVVSKKNTFTTTTPVTDPKEWPAKTGLMEVGFEPTRFPI
jgi:hypothetical protein